MNRHARQERVLGSEAQRRLRAQTVRVQSTSSASASVEARYLAGAGVAGLSGPPGAWMADASALDGAVVVRADDPPAPVADDAAAWTDELAPAAGDFVRGALRALQTLRRAAR